MSIPKISTFDFEQLSYSPELRTTRAGGKCAQLGYGAGKAQVKFQLGDSMREALLCKWGADYASREEASKPEPKRVIKLTLTDKAKNFLERFEATTLAAAEDNSMAWFKKKKPTGMYNSRIKSDGEHGTDFVLLRLEEYNQDPEKRTLVETIMWKNGKRTEPVPGTIEDITPGSMVLATVRVQNGVYFQNTGYGTSLVAETVLVVKDAEAPSQPSSYGRAKIDYGSDVEMAGSNDNDEEEDELSDA